MFGCSAYGLWILENQCPEDTFLDVSFIETSIFYFNTFVLSVIRMGKVEH
jgi:hypothetical protein